MLPSVHRMRRSADFTSVVRAGFRARTGRVAVHYAPHLTERDGPVVGFVVSKTVGNSVERHAVVRRLRALMAQRLELLPATSGTVVRALPPAAGSTSTDLARDLDRALTRVQSCAGAR